MRRTRDREAAKAQAASAEKHNFNQTSTTRPHDMPQGTVKHFIQGVTAQPQAHRRAEPEAGHAESAPKARWNRRNAGRLAASTGRSPSGPS
jgi:hypothetical protein